MKKPTLTIGMAHHDDFSGVYFSVQALRLYHAEVMPQIEIVVVDSSPESADGKAVRVFLEEWVKGDVAGVKYIPMLEPKGTAPPRNRVFQEASGEYVLCMDCHVLIPPFRIDQLLEYYRANPQARDLLSGPMIYDDLRNRATHFADEWRGEMWGTWNTDLRGDPYLPGYTGEPFEIPAQGLGLFTCRKDAWLGFNPNFRGFGGEEWYIHEKFRRAGHKCLCLPWLGWVHRFGRPGGAKYPLTRFDKVRNYVIGHRELGLPLDRVHEHFVKSGLMKQGEWDAILAGGEALPLGGCVGCGGTSGQPAASDPYLSAKPNTLEEWYTHALKNQGIGKHLPKLRELASQADFVTELGGDRSASTVALAVSGKEVLVVDPREWREDVWLAEMTSRKVQFVRKRSEQCEEAFSLHSDSGEGLLFIDTVHTANQAYAELVRFAPYHSRIVFHDTATYGETGQDKGPGLLPALRRYMREHPEWSVIYHTQEQYGLTVISRNPADKKPLPSVITMGWNYAKSLTKHAATGAKVLPAKQVEARLAICLTCEQRTGNRCAVCGCFLDEAPPPMQPKALWAEAECPLGKWPLPMVEAKEAKEAKK
jgi:glycosyltransferase involved in cell wall biosynthesis